MLRTSVLISNGDEKFWDCMREHQTIGRVRFETSHGQTKANTIPAQIPETRHAAPNMPAVEL